MFDKARVCEVMKEMSIRIEEKIGIMETNLTNDIIA